MIRHIDRHLLYCLYVFNLGDYLLSNRILLRLEVRAHVALKVEVSKLITLLQLQQLREGRVGVDLTTIGLILQVVVADVRVDLTSHLSASHLSTGGLLQERGKLIADESRLHETTGGTVAGLPLALLAVTLSGLQTLVVLTLESRELSLEGGYSGLGSLQRVGELSKEVRLLNSLGGSGLNGLRGLDLSGLSLSRGSSSGLLRGGSFAYPGVYTL